MTQYEFPPQPRLSSSEGMERVVSSMLDEVKAGKMAVKASIFDQEFAMSKGVSTGMKSWKESFIGGFIDDEDLRTIALDR
jgi:hypothetical protein